MNDNINYNEAWIIIKKTFPILNDSQSVLQLDDSYNYNIYDIANLLKTLNISKTFQDLVIEKIKQRLRVEVAPDFWTYFKKIDNNGFKQFYNAVKSLFDYFSKLQHTIAKLELISTTNGVNTQIYNENSLHDALKLMNRATLLSQIPITEYQMVIAGFYEATLKMEDPENMEKSEGRCIVCLQDSQHCNCVNLFHETNLKLKKMELLEPLAGQAITNLSYNYILAHIQEICKDNFDSPCLEILEKWLQTVVINWLKKVYCYNLPEVAIRDNYLDELDKKLITYLYNTYARTRVDQLFNIIIEYPESLPALEDLKQCLPKTDQMPHLIRKLQRAMETRLLHPGVSTPDILTAYVAAIRSLRTLDPTGLILDSVTHPVHQYLRGREDTVRCVVSSLTDEGHGDLAEELAKREVIHMDEHNMTDDDVNSWKSWNPDPINNAFVSDQSSDMRRTSDIISMLVNVYGSKELFVNEYRTLLADRLLTQYTCDTEKEIRYLELLKIRFGDSQLHYCEVMLKDIADSKRINQHIKQESNYFEGDIPLTAIVVSAQFWPAFKDEKLELHQKLLDQMKDYTSAFETLKGNRTLCWKNHLGIVDLEIELSDRTLNLSVSPVHATILMHFQDKNSWSLEDLSKIIQIPPTILRKKLSFWQSHGIIIETDPDVFYLQEERENKINNVVEDIVIEDSESESAMASAQDQREEELQTFWSYILGMLMNLDTLPLERIHQMLKMFAFQGPTIECSMQELKVFLDRKVREHQLIYSNGLYRLPK